MNRLLLYVLPSSLFYADRLTLSARRLIARSAVAAGALVLGLVAVGLFNASNWREILAGALLAWSVSLIVWAVSSYRAGREGVQTDLRRVAEFDLLHARLNHLAARLEAPTIALSGGVEDVLQAREERLAHFAGVDEFRGKVSESGSVFWDAQALGEPSP